MKLESGYGLEDFYRSITMNKCPYCGESVTYTKTVRSRQLKKRWNIFVCGKCGKVFRELK